MREKKVGGRRRSVASRAQRRAAKAPASTMSQSCRSFGPEGYVVGIMMGVVRDVQLSTA